MRKWQPTPVFVRGKSHGQRSLAGYSLWGCKESDMTEHAHTHTHKSNFIWKLQSPKILGCPSVSLLRIIQPFEQQLSFWSKIENSFCLEGIQSSRDERKHSIVNCTTVTQLRKPFLWKPMIVGASFTPVGGCCGVFYWLHRASHLCLFRLSPWFSKATRAWSITSCSISAAAASVTVSWTMGMSATTRTCPMPSSPVRPSFLPGP